MNGAPANASSGTDSGSSAARISTACNTYGASAGGSNGRRADHVGRRPEWRLTHRPGAGRDIDAETDRVSRDDDVAVQHGGVDAVATDRLQGQFGGEIWLLDGVEDAALTAPGPVLGKAATGLAHEPHRSVRAAMAAGCQEERRDRHASRTLQAPNRRLTCGPCPRSESTILLSRNTASASSSSTRTTSPSSRPGSPNACRSADRRSAR